jgi:uncharacterized protein (TIGR02147 family)
MNNDVTSCSFWLAEQYRQAKARNPRMSLRGFAARLRTSPATLSQVLSGKRHLTIKMTHQFCERLKLNEIEKQAAVRAVKTARSQQLLPNDAEINAATDIMFEAVSMTTFADVGNWYYFAILSLAEVKSNCADSQWIAARLGISLEQAATALDKLLAIGLIAKEGIGFVRVGRNISIETEGYEAEVQQFLCQHLDKAKQALTQTPAALREVNTVTLAIDPECIPQARAMMKRFRRELSALLESGNKSRIYSFATQLYPLDHTEHREL